VLERARGSGVGHIPALTARARAWGARFNVESVKPGSREARSKAVREHQGRCARVCACVRGWVCGCVGGWGGAPIHTTKRGQGLGLQSSPCGSGSFLLS